MNATMKSIIDKVRRSLSEVKAAPNEASTQTGRSGRRWLRLGIVLLILIAIGVLFRLTLLRPPSVSTVTVRRSDVAAEVEGTGTVTADALANITSRITGRVEKVFADEGDTVHKNQILTVLDQTGLRLRVAVAQARLNAALAVAAERQREWVREKDLIGSGAVGVEAMQGYRERYVVAQSAVDSAKAELGDTDYKLSRSQIPTLLSGIVTKRWVVPGASVVPGQPMFTVADTNLIFVNTFIDQNFAGNVHKGETATVILRGRENQPVRGHVLRIRPRADAATEESVVEVAFDIPADQFQLDQWANVYIRTREAKSALVIPQTALMPMGNDLFVWVVGADDKLRRERVTLLARSPRSPQVAVAGALREGDHVVLMPMGLRSGETVRPVAMNGSQAMGMPQ